MAYYESWVRDAYRGSGLEIVEPDPLRRLGRARRRRIHNQDVVLARRPG